jgi:DNA-binding beta-propeller fold protein YncE
MKRWLAVFGLVLTASACASPISTRTTPEGNLAPGAYRVWLGDGFNRSTPMTVVDGTGKTLRSIPQGAAASDWSRLYTIDRQSGTPLLQALDPASGETINKIPVPYVFDFPQGFLGDRSSGLSPNNAWIVLQSLERKGPQGGTVEASHYLVLDKDLKIAARKVDLKGYWAYDSISNDGNSLFLLQYVSQPPQPVQYHVRRYDLSTGQLAAGTIADKRERAGAMSGLRVQGIPTPDGSWLYSLYINEEKGPFIHALNLTAEPFAWCIDLPSKTNDYEKQLLWSMAMTPDGNKVYAINASLGTVSEIAIGRPDPPSITRSASFKVSNVKSFDWFGLVLNVEAKRIVFGGAALSPDAKTLYAVGEDGVYVIDTGKLTLKGHYLAGRALDSLVLSPDGAALFAAGEAGKLLRLDTATWAQSEIATKTSRGVTIFRVQSAS